MFFRNSQPLQYFLVMWILRGESCFTERNPKQKRHPFSHATQVFARFENPFFFELASIYVLLVLTYFSNVWVVVFLRTSGHPNWRWRTLFGSPKETFPTSKNHPPVLKPAFFSFIGPFSFGRKVFGGVCSQLWGLGLGDPPSGWLNSLGWHLWWLPCFLLHGVWRGFLGENDWKKKHLARNL